jgi:hypothetical protein
LERPKENRAAFDFGAMHHGTVANRDVVANRAGKAGVCMKNAAVLDVGSSPDVDRFRIAANHRAKPHARFGPHRHIAEYDRTRGDEGASVDLIRAEVGIDGHAEWRYL